ncbi:hypothetical protein BJ878DRAFT_42579 [Calycina marina]|uniref:Uncharacterized protein n=1 Tax=Calycina marina TaxID=1763456 RepID=A0A9P7Z430_9HELO|nr:hypothetical protein BJ878DRAFT_42579 [Calycina marina]
MSEQVAVTSLTTGAIAGIAIAGFVGVLFAVITPIIYYLKRRDQRLRIALVNVEAQHHETKELAAFLRLDRPRDDYIPNSLNVVPSLFPAHRKAGSIQADTIVPKDIIDDEPLLARVNTMRLSPTRALSRLSTGLRDSWPLANTGQMPNALHGLARLQSQSQPTITLNQVAPPGYLIATDPKYPNRAYSKNSKTKVPKDVTRQNRNLSSIDRPSQLTTILRSTSDRLKPSQTRRQSPSRTLTNFSRSGPPPREKLPSPSRPIRVKESREVLIDKRSTVSIVSSTFGEDLLRTPSRIVDDTATSRQVMSTASSPGGNDDSLCASDTKYQPLTVSLSSPDKVRHATNGSVARGISPVKMSPASSADCPSMVQKKCRGSLQVLATQSASLLESHDPFYTTGERNSSHAESKIRDPKPLFIRKSTATLETPQLPLDNVPGNSQSQSNRNSESDNLTAERNTFQWSPQEASRSSSLTIQTLSKVHKRSKTVQMSVLPVSMPSVPMVPEESEESDHETLPLRFHVPSPGLRMAGPLDSPSPNPLRASLVQRRKQIRPPTAPVFDPHRYIAPKIPMGTMVDSPSGDIQIYSPTMPSPISSSPTRLSPIRLSPMRLSHHFVTGEYEKASLRDTYVDSKSKLSLTTAHTRRECRIATFVSPTTLLDEMIGFPKPPARAHSYHPKQSIGFVPASFSIIPTTRPASIQTPDNIMTTGFHQPSKSPALSPNSEILKALEKYKVPQPVLPLPSIPGHFTGPRDISSAFESPVGSLNFRSSYSSSPSRPQNHNIINEGSLDQSTSVLRRMNSDVTSPTNNRERSGRRETGSLCYHNLSNEAVHRCPASSKNRISKHSSAAERRVSKIIAHRNMALEREYYLRDMSSEPEIEFIVDGTHVDPILVISSSPVTESESDLPIAGLRFSSLFRDNKLEYSLPDLATVAGNREDILELESPVRAQDWSDNIAKTNCLTQPERQPPGSWKQIVLTPRGDDDEGKENSTLHHRPAASRIFPVQLKDGRPRSSAMSSPECQRLRESRTSQRSQTTGTESIISNRKSGVRFSIPSDDALALERVKSKSGGRKRKDRSAGRSPKDKFSPNSLRKRPRTLWQNLNDSPRESLYDSDGFLRSSPTA